MSKRKIKSLVSKASVQIKQITSAQCQRSIYHERRSCHRLSHLRRRFLPATLTVPIYNVSPQAIRNGLRIPEIYQHYINQRSSVILFPIKQDGFYFLRSVHIVWLRGYVHNLLELYSIALPVTCCASHTVFVRVLKS